MNQQYYEQPAPGPRSNSRRNLTIVSVVAAIALIVGGTMAYLGLRHRTATVQIQVVGGTTESASPPAPQCKDVTAEGAIIPKTMPQTGCIDVQGNLQIDGSFDCTDGRILFGASTFWGYAGGKAHHERAETSKAYGKAYNACVG